MKDRASDGHDPDVSSYGYISRKVLSRPSGHVLRSPDFLLRDDPNRHQRWPSVFIRARSRPETIWQVVSSTVGRAAVSVPIVEGRSVSAS